MRYQSPYNPAPVDADIRLDLERRIVHVLDLDRGGMTVTNGIDQIQPMIAFRYELGDINTWQWWLYGTDGVVCAYDRNSREYKSITDEEQWHPDFRDIMLERAKRIQY